MESIKLSGELVRLRAYHKGEAEEIMKKFGQTEVQKYLTPSIPYPVTLLDEEKWLERQSAFKEEYNFAIETLEAGKYIGGCGVNKIDFKNRWCFVGIFIGDEAFLSKGYGSEAMKLLIQFCFYEMNMNKVKLGVYSFNPRAIKSYKKVGFKEDGVLREDLFRFGKYHDVISMSILRSEFDAKYGQEGI